MASWNEDQKGGSLHFMTDKANMGQTSLVAVATAEGLVRVWWHSIAIPPPVPFVLRSGSAGVSEWGDNMTGSEMPGFMVFS